MIRNVLIQSKGHIVIMVTNPARKGHFSAHNLRLGMPWLACTCAKFQALHCKQIGDKLSHSRDLTGRRFHRCLSIHTDERDIVIFPLFHFKLITRLHPIAIFLYYYFSNGSKFSSRIAFFLILSSSMGKITDCLWVLFLDKKLVKWGSLFSHSPLLVWIVLLSCCLRKRRG